jgi:AcrR family transcriptional regulator
MSMPKISDAARDARREQILTAALRCFARRGYHATTIEEIVEESGLSRGALYLYYPGKEALYLALADRWNCGLERRLRQVLEADRSPAARLRRLILLVGEHVQAEADACRVLMESWQLSQSLPALRQDLLRRQEEARSLLGGLLRAGIAAGELRCDLDVEDEAQLLLATLHGVMALWHLDPLAVNWARTAEAILHGLRA